MGKKASLSVAQRAQIVAFSKMKLSERQIGNKLKVSKTAVHNAIQKFKNEGTFADKKRTGRPKIFSPRDKRLMRKIVTRSPMTSGEKIRSQLQERGCKVSTRTVQRRLFTEFGLKSHKPARKPCLTEGIKKKRLSFAKAHAHWTVDMWKKVLFSDESSMKQFCVRKYRVWRPAGKRYEEKYTTPTVKHPPSLMVWGAMSAMRTASLSFLPPKTTMNGTKYVALLRSKLQLHMSVHNCSIFMHDGAPCHRSKAVVEFLEQENVQVLDWPGHSPDLNPIENLWNLMKAKVAEKYPSNLNELQQVIKEVWVQELSSEYCYKLVSSMPGRMQAVIASKGGHTKY